MMWIVVRLERLNVSALKDNDEVVESLYERILGRVRGGVYMMFIIHKLMN